jgi:hypothetical protein
MARGLAIINEWDLYGKTTQVAKGFEDYSSYCLLLLYGGGLRT